MKNNNLIFLIALAIALGACCKSRKDDISVPVPEKYKDWLVDNNNLACVFKEVNSGEVDTAVYKASTNNFDCQRENNGSWLFPCHRNECIEDYINQDIVNHPRKIQYYVYRYQAENNVNYIGVAGGTAGFEYHRDGGGQVMQKVINGNMLEGKQCQIKIVNSSNTVGIFVVPNKGAVQYQYMDSTGKEMTWERIN